MAGLQLHRGQRNEDVCSISWDFIKLHMELSNTALQTDSSLFMNSLKTPQLHLRLLLSCL